MARVSECLLSTGWRACKDLLLRMQSSHLAAALLQKLIWAPDYRGLLLVAQAHYNPVVTMQWDEIWTWSLNSTL